MASIIKACDYAWRDIWEPLRQHDEAPIDMFMELYPEFSKAIDPASPEMDLLYEASNNPAVAERVFQELSSSSLRSERSVIRFFVEAHSIIDVFGLHSLTEHYVQLLQAFLERYNLRFRVHTPFDLSIEPGALFCSMFDEVTKKALCDPHLQSLDAHLRRAFSLLARDGNLAEVNTCVRQTVNYLEGLAAAMPGLTPEALTTLLPRMAGTWPHSGVQKALSCLYGFGSQYPICAMAATLARN